MMFQVLTLVALIFSVIGLLLGIIALVLCVGLKNSTHKVQWVPMNEGPEVDLAKEMEKLYTEM